LATFQRCEKSMKNCVFCETEGCMNANNLLEAPSFRVGRPQFTYYVNIFAFLNKLKNYNIFGPPGF